MSRIYALFGCLLLLLAGCAAHQGYGTLSSHERIAVGSRIILHRELTIPANQTRIFLQRGQVSVGGFDQYYPHCNFEVRSLSEMVRSIVPDDFTVTRVQEGFEEVVGLDESAKVAALEAVSLYGVFGTDQSLVSRFVHFYLTSQHQPDVMRLTCHGAFDFRWDAELPTVAEIREALGEFATLEGYPKPGMIESR